MKCFQLPRTIRALIFDMDSTLYTNEAYVRAQNDLSVERLAEIKGLSFGEMQEQLDAYRREWAEKHGGKLITMGDTLTVFGIPIEENIRWREELNKPEQFLSEDRKLRESLLTLGEKYSLGLLTNNPASIARRTLSALGVEDCFNVIVGLDTSGFSKPHRTPFLMTAEGLGAAPGHCVSVGDRYDIDLALPLELGMGGILVDGVEDVYGIPRMLDGRDLSCNPIHNEPTTNEY